MACFKPLEGYQQPNGGWTANRKKSTGKLMSVPCGQCLGCRMDRSKDWATRIVHEAQYWEEKGSTSTFITLTYNDEHLPLDRSVNPEHFQKFMKRLRKAYPGKTIRYFHCGEYGEKYRRPHYHAILFNIDFEDKILWKYSNGKKRDPIYISRQLRNIWGKGFTSIGDVTPESAAYVARYCVKKQNGSVARYHYDVVGEHSTQVYHVSPEYATMSRGRRKEPPFLGGIGYPWYEKYGDKEIWPDDFVLIKSGKTKKKVPVPRYYDNLYEENHGEEFAQVKALREQKAKRHKDNNSRERLAVREKVLEAKLQRLPRELEDSYE